MSASTVLQASPSHRPPVLLAALLTIQMTHMTRTSSFSLSLSLLSLTCYAQHYVTTFDQCPLIISSTIVKYQLLK